MYDIEKIKEALPHRFPFLLVDRVLEVEPGKRIKAVKNVTFNEPFFQGHFPIRSVMPGVLILEALAQAGGIMMMEGTGSHGAICYLTTVDKAKFRHPVVPGDQLVLEVEVERVVGKMGKVRGRALVNDQLAAEATLGFVQIEQGAEE